MLLFDVGCSATEADLLKQLCSKLMITHCCDAFAVQQQQSYTVWWLRSGVRICHMLASYACVCGAAEGVNHAAIAVRRSGVSRHHVLILCLCGAAASAAVLRVV
jgi:hypothetical protein